LAKTSIKVGGGGVCAKFGFNGQASVANLVGNFGRVGWTRPPDTVSGGGKEPACERNQGVIDGRMLDAD
jgi:hypothetical protein